MVFFGFGVLGRKEVCRILERNDFSEVRVAEVMFVMQKKMPVRQSPHQFRITENSRLERCNRSFDNPLYRLQTLRNERLLLAYFCGRSRR